MWSESIRLMDPCGAMDEYVRRELEKQAWRESRPVLRASTPVTRAIRKIRNIIGF